MFALYRPHHADCKGAGSAATLCAWRATERAPSPTEVSSSFRWVGAAAVPRRNGYLRP